MLAAYRMNWMYIRRIFLDAIGTPPAVPGTLR
jgi:hypothetical protein